MDPTKQPQQTPIPMPQTGELTAPDDAVDSLAAPPDLGSVMAQNTIKAGQTNNGNPRDWAENAVAGVQAALAGFGAAGRVPPGAGALYGVGAASKQAQERRDEQNKEKQEQATRQKQLDLEQQRVTNEKTGQDREYQLRLAENARQQAEAVRQQSEHDARMQQLSDEHSTRNFQLMDEEVKFRQEQLDREETLKTIGAKPMQIGGQETPGFDDLGHLERYALDNNLAQDAHSNGYRARPVLGADGKYHIYEVPDAGPEWHTVKDPTGKDIKIFGDPLSVLNYQEKVAQVHEANARATLTYNEAKKQQEDFKDAGTVKAARAELTKVNGDYSKLSPGAREALSGDAQKRFDLSWNVYQTARRDMQRDPDFAGIPVDANGNPDKNSQQYKDLAAEYHVADAEAQVGQAFDELRQLGHGYSNPGAHGAQPEAGAGGQKPGAQPAANAQILQQHTATAQQMLEQGQSADAVKQMIQSSSQPPEVKTALVKFVDDYEAKKMASAEQSAVNAGRF